MCVDFWYARILPNPFPSVIYLGYFQTFPRVPVTRSLGDCSSVLFTKRGGCPAVLTFSLFITKVNICFL